MHAYTQSVFAAQHLVLTIHTDITDSNILIRQRALNQGMAGPKDILELFQQSDLNNLNSTVSSSVFSFFQKNSFMLRFYLLIKALFWIRKLRNAMLDCFTVWCWSVKMNMSSSNQSSYPSREKQGEGHQQALTFSWLTLPNMKPSSHTSEPDSDVETYLTGICF